MELFGMIVVLLVIVVLASDYARRKKGLDCEEVPEKPLRDKMFEEMEVEEHRRCMDPSFDKIYWGDPWGDRER